MQKEQIVDDLLSREKYRSLPEYIIHLHKLLHDNLQTSDPITSDLVDTHFMEEIAHVVSQRDIVLYFGTSLRVLKCDIPDNDGRVHELLIQYKAPNKLCVTNVALPHTPLHDREYSCIDEIINTFETYIDSLTAYFTELDRIDNFCTVMEPPKPSFKDDYRRILLDDRTWLHIEVTPNGFASNIYLLGHSEEWHEKLQSGLTNWDHDKDIIENITKVLDIIDFPALPSKSSISLQESSHPAIEDTNCSICLCSDLSDIPGLPQPLCQNTKCVAYFHRNCLFQWLVDCSGGRPPAFGVATGSCPACLASTSCNKED